MSTIRNPYLGLPGDMHRLGVPQGAMTAAASYGDTAHGLASGGTSVTRWGLNAECTYQLPYDYLRPDDSDLLTGLYDGLYGDPPYRFVDPTVRNVLPLDTASCGARSRAFHGWTVSAGTIARDLSVAAPDDAADSGVLLWTGSVTTGRARPGLIDGTNPDLATTAPWLPPEACTASLYVRTSTSTSMQLVLVGSDTSGAVLSQTLATTATATTSWQRIGVTAGPYESALTGCAYVSPRLVVVGTAPTSVWIAAAQLEYAGERSAWQKGYGTPRVNIQAPGRTIPQYGWAAHTVSLVQA